MIRAKRYKSLAAERTHEYDGRVNENPARPWRIFILETIFSFPPLPYPAHTLFYTGVVRAQNRGSGQRAGRPGASSITIQDAVS